MAFVRSNARSAFACFSVALSPAAFRPERSCSGSACTEGVNAKQTPPQPKVRFGAIADVQYADVDDAPNFSGTSIRRYRGALTSLQLAVKEWQASPSVDFIVDLGDIIDQQCESRGESRKCLDRVLQAWEPIKVPVIRLMGNHELYNFNRAECETLIPGIAPSYRRAWHGKGWRVLSLDPYELNVIERGGGQAVEAGLDYLSKHNPNNLRAPRGSVDLSKGLEGFQRRFLPMAGALQQEQLRWLRSEVQEAGAAGERVIVLTHVPLHPAASTPGALCWNYEEVLKVLDTAGTVSLVLAGHYHPGGYFLDEASGIHHVTLPSPLHTTDQEPCAHCWVEVFDDRIDIVGRGLARSYSLQLRARAAEVRRLAAAKL